MFFVYVLRSEVDQKLYVGYTTNLKQRLVTHNKGGVKSTKSRRPLTLIYSEIYTNKQDALRREKYFKTTAGKGALKHMLRETLKTDKELLKSA